MIRLTYRKTLRLLVPTLALAATVGGPAVADAQAREVGHTARAGAGFSASASFGAGAEGSRTRAVRATRPRRAVPEHARATVQVEARADARAARRTRARARVDRRVAHLDARLSLRPRQERRARRILLDAHARMAAVRAPTHSAEGRRARRGIRRRSILRIEAVLDGRQRILYRAMWAEARAERRGRREHRRGHGRARGRVALERGVHPGRRGHRGAVSPAVAVYSCPPPPSHEGHGPPPFAHRSK